MESKDDYSDKDGEFIYNNYHHLFEIMKHTEKFDLELSKFFKFEKLVVVSELDMLAKAKIDYKFDNNSGEKLTEVQTLRSITRVVERRVNSVNEFTVVQRAEGPTDVKKCGPKTLK